MHIQIQCKFYIRIISPVYNISILAHTQTIQMGTPGFKVYRHKGWYFSEYNHYESQPDGFGATVLDEVPTDPEEFWKWLESTRKDFDELLEEHQVSLNDRDAIEDYYTISNVPFTWHGFEWVYEIDLDRLIFHVNCAPVFRLDHMPPTDLFIQGIDSNIYGKAACGQIIPDEYRFNPNLLPAPSVEHSMLETYQSSVQEGTPCAVNTLLSLNAVPVIEEIIIQERNTYFHICMCAWINIVSELALLPDAKAISQSGRYVAFNLAALALLPISHIRPEFFGEHDSDSEGNKVQEVHLASPQERVWWPRRHICVLLATHLVHEDNRKAAIVQVAEEIMRKADAPDVVFGVVFSVFHCVLVRIDRNDDKKFIHTDLLPYCPDLFTASAPSERTTIGLEVMVRLGNLAAGDDEDFFYDLLRSSSTSERPADTECPESQSTSQAALLPGERRLPQEMINHIAELIDDSRALSAFALASRSTMAAAIPRLRLPNLFLHDGNTGIVLQRNLPVSEHMYLTNATFGAQHEGQPVIVTLSNDCFPPGKDGTWIVRDSMDIPLAFKPPRERLPSCVVCYTVSHDAQSSSST